MRAVVQTVSRACVRVDAEAVGEVVGDDVGEIVGQIENGLLVLVGVTHDDTPAKAETLARKIYGLRILDGERSASDLAAPVLVVSQFTLYANVERGRRPSWGAAAKAEIAEPLIVSFVEALRTLGAAVETGRFRAHMRVESVNVGPCTIVLDL